ncbi:hypothetical protein BGZ94_000820 [Podila epigama]|nr:hypothetical protein BGZ94_000820 [Podila epigama]
MNSLPDTHPSTSSSATSSVSGTLMGYIGSAMSKGQEVFQKVTTQAQDQAQRATGFITRRHSETINHGTANRQTTRGDRRGSGLTGLPQYRSQIEQPTSHPSFSHSNGSSTGNSNSNSFTNGLMNTPHTHQSQEIGNPHDTSQFSHSNPISYSSHHYAAAHPSFKSSQGGM